MTFEHYLNQELEKDDVLRKEYEALQPEYKSISQRIKTELSVEKKRLSRSESSGSASE